MKAMRAIDSFEDGTDIKAWLLTILRRTHIDRQRRSQRRVNELPLEADLETQGDEAPVPTPDRLDDQWADPDGPDRTV